MTKVMIYLDYSATTPLDSAVLKKMQPYFSRLCANPASVHTPGQSALKAVDDARYRIAELLEAKGQEIIFTSGATEANNFALRGVVEEHGYKNSHVITTPIEHDSILEPCQYLKQQGTSVTYLIVDKHGRVRPEDVIAAITDKTVLVSIGYVNGETGLVQPIKKIGRLIKNHNEKAYKAWLNTPTRKRGAKPTVVRLHVDATQALNFFDCRPDYLHADLMSFSAHKIYGPKGTGCLYLRSGIKAKPLLYGGHQERNLRSGTVNVPGAIGLAEAWSLALKKQVTNNKKISSLRDRLARGITKRIPKAAVNTFFDQSSPSHFNVSFPDWEGDLLMSKLDDRGIAVSTGSACASGDLTASHVLVAMGRTEEQARSALRFTVGKGTTAAEIDRTIAALAAIFIN